MRERCRSLDLCWVESVCTFTDALPDAATWHATSLSKRASSDLIIAGTKYATSGPKTSMGPKGSKAACWPADTAISLSSGKPSRSSPSGWTHALDDGHGKLIARGLKSFLAHLTPSSVAFKCQNLDQDDPTAQPRHACLLKCGCTSGHGHAPHCLRRWSVRCIPGTCPATRRPASFTRIPHWRQTGANVASLVQAFLALSVA
jgi:hypothetical protein